MKLEECEKELHRLVEKSESLASERGEALEMIAMLKEELEVANTETQRAKEQASKAEAEKVAEKAAREESAFQTALMVIRLEELCDEGKKQQKKDNEAWSQKLQETLEQANQQHQRACDILRTQNQALEQELETVRAEERNKLREVTEECERQKSLLRQAEHNYQARKKESEEKISIMEFQKLELGLERESLKRELQRHVNEKMSLEDSITRLEEKNYGLLGETKQLMEEKGLTISLHTSEDINERLLKEVVELKQEKDAMLQLFEEEIDALKDAKLLEEVEELKEEGFCAGEAKSLGTKVNKLKKEKEEASSQFKRPETETNRLQDELKSRFQKARAYIARLEEDKKLLLTEVMKVKKQMKKAAKDDQQSRMELARVVQKLRQELVDQKYLTDQKFKRLQQQPQFYKEQYEKRNAMVAEGVELRLNEMRRSPYVSWAFFRSPSSAKRCEKCLR